MVGTNNKNSRNAKAQLSLPIKLDTKFFFTHNKLKKKPFSLFGVQKKNQQQAAKKIQRLKTVSFKAASLHQKTNFLMFAKLGQKTH